MKFRSERDVLAKALTTASRATSGHSGSPVLMGLLLRVDGDALAVTGTNLDLGIRVHCEVSGTEDGALVVPARLVSDIVKSLEPGSVTLSADNEVVDIVGGKSKFALRGWASDDFPLIASMDTSDGVIVSALSLREGLNQVVRAASTDDARPVLTGVLVSNEGGVPRFVATDSYRLAIRDIDGIKGIVDADDILVPSSALGEVLRLVSDKSIDDDAVSVVIREHDAVFARGSVAISTRLLDGTYPNYRQLVPDQQQNSLTVDKSAIMSALGRVRLLVRDNTTPVKLSMTDGRVDLSVQSTEVGDASESVDAEYVGTDLNVAFNPTYLMDGIDAIVGESIMLETSGATKPATLRSPDDDTYTYLIMPVRVS